MLVKLLVGAAIISGSLVSFAAASGAFPSGERPAISCDAVTIDPPSAPYVKVTFWGAINGAPFQRTVQYGAPTPHIARADIRDLTARGGHLQVTVTANGGWLGISPTTTARLTCPGTSAVLAAQETAAHPNTSGATLPFTGAPLWEEALAGGTVLAVGAMILAAARLWKGRPAIRKVLRVYASPVSG
jgi:hypothetical protein